MLCRIKKKLEVDQNLNHEQRISRALAFIEENLQNPIHVKDVASTSALSERHLYRLFKNLYGDSLQNYVRNRRVTEASKALVQGNKKVLDVALDYQFASAEVFNRAFNRLLHISPREFKKIGSPFSSSQQNAFCDDHLDIFRCGEMAQPQPLFLPERQMTGYLVKQCHYGLREDSENQGEIQTLSNDLKNRLSGILQIQSDQEWNVAFRRQNFQDFHQLENFICVESKLGSKPPSDCVALVLPAHQYLKFIHQGSPEHIHFTLNRAFHYLADSSWYLGDAPSMFRVVKEQPFIGELYLPVGVKAIRTKKWWKGYHTKGRL